MGYQACDAKDFDFALSLLAQAQRSIKVLGKRFPHRIAAQSLKSKSLYQMPTAKCLLGILLMMLNKQAI